MRKVISLLICLFSMYSCQVAKIEASQNKKQLQKEFAETLTFSIELEAASPMQTTAFNSLSNTNLIAPGNTVGRFNISQTSAYFRMEGDQVDMSLPYFGERRMGGGYNDDNGIEYKGKIDDLKVEFNEKKKYYRISFSAQKNTESFDVNIQLFQNLNIQMFINTSHRSNIRYDGYAEELPKKEGEAVD